MTGRVEVEDVLAAVRSSTCLISIMMANNETGVLMVRDTHTHTDGQTDGKHGLVFHTYMVLTHTYPQILNINPSLSLQLKHNG